MRAVASRATRFHETGELLEVLREDGTHIPDPAMAGFVSTLPPLA